jgi:hypothetical protein
VPGEAVAARCFALVKPFAFATFADKLERYARSIAPRSPAACRG